MASVVIRRLLWTWVPSIFLKFDLTRSLVRSFCLFVAVTFLAIGVLCMQIPWLFVMHEPLRSKFLPNDKYF